MAKKPITETDIAPEQPHTGGTYVRDPVTGKLTLVPTPMPVSESTATKETPTQELASHE